MEYVALNTPDAIYIVAQALLSEVIVHNHLMSAAIPSEPASAADVLSLFPGTALDGATFQHPFLDRTILGVNATYVTADQGTGAVHTAPAHGVDDFATGKRYNLPEVQYVDDSGRQMHTERFGGHQPQPYEGLTVFKSNPVIIELLKERGALLSATHLEHSYPHCWRCHNPVITRATEQWFIDMETPMPATAGSFESVILSERSESKDPEGLGSTQPSSLSPAQTTTFRQRALDEIKTVKWDPAWGEERITNMVATRPDWCISRQRIWGVPIAVFLCRKCGEPLRDAAINKSIVALFMRESADAWYIHTPEDLLPAGTACSCGHTEFRKEMDILDVWFESGSSSHAVLDFDADVQQKPSDPDPRADLYAEGGDQHRGWFMSSLLCGIGMHNRAPFKSVATYGWTLDEKGRALSKSLGNFIDPVAIMDQLGGDIVRLWVASVDFREDVVASLPLLQRLAKEIYFKLRNTFKFLLSNMYDFDPAANSVEDFAALEPLDQYMLARTAELTSKITKAYADFEFHRVYHLLNEFCNSDLSALYLDVLKDRLYTFAPNHPARRSAQTVIYKITDALARLTAPLLSFTADEVWQALPPLAGRASSVHLTLFPNAGDFVAGDPLELTKGWDKLLELRTAVLAKLESLRAQKIIGKSLEAIVTLYVKETDANLRKYATSLPELFNVSEVDFLTVTHNDPDYLPNIDVRRSEQPKCDRCWRHVPDVGHNANYPTVCLRCAEALDAIDFPPYPALSST
jgi:isoleucyl-tRNA synthetase